MAMIEKYGLQIDAQLHDFLVNEALPGTGVDAESYFKAIAAIFTDLTPKNRTLLEKRDAM